jgi:type I restriction enzyme M protein
MTTTGKKKSSSENSSSPNGNGVMALVRELWQAAVNLRGSIEPADYKRYVLPIIFLRFLSLRYERRRTELETSIGDVSSDYFSDSKALEDPDEYRSAGAFIVPEQARWENIVKHAQDDDIKVQLDNILELMEKTYPERLRGLLPKIYAGSNLDRENVTGLINLFSKDVFRQDHGGEDLVGRVYEYFIGEFASSEGKRGGEYFTPQSIVKTLVAMLEPEEGIVFDPCCGSGGMFVQSDQFTKHNRKLSFVGQESKDFTYRLCRMNLFIHGIDGNIQLGNSYFDDKHATLKADYILANPPFNDGSKGENGWGANRVADKDPRLVIGNDRMTLAPRNANTMWIMHFLYHLKESGTAGFVMGTGELSSPEVARFATRKALVDQDYIDCIVQLSGKLFANTQIPCSLCIISKNRNGNGEFRFRKRTGEILFIDGRKLGTLIPGSRKQKQFSMEEIDKIATVYKVFQTKQKPDEVPGFCKVVSTNDIQSRKYTLTPGRYVAMAEGEDDDDPFEEKFPRLVKLLDSQFIRSASLQAEIQSNLKKVLDEN